MKTKKLFGVLLCALLICVCVFQTNASGIVFTDVEAGQWYTPHINYAVENGIFKGTSTTTFSPSTNMTRAQFVQVLANISNVDTTNNTVSTQFSDVPSKKWYTAAIKWASENGVVNGIGNGIFAPEQPVTREQMCVMLVNYVEKFQKNSLQSSVNTLSFWDDGKIASWSKSSVYKCANAGLVNGVGNNTFDPQGTTTRAQGATFFSNFHKYSEKNHTHSYSAATCTAPAKCSCGATNGSALGHNWQDATCSSPKKCSRCGDTSGDVLEHNYQFYVCENCGKENVPDQGLEFSLLDNGTYSVSTGTATRLSTIVIPSTYMNRKVTEIESLESSNLKTLIVSNNIKNFYCYEETKNLEKVYFNGTLEQWCEIKFFGGTPMKYASDLYIKNTSNGYITPPSKITIKSLNAFTFFGCKTIKEVVVTDTITEIPERAFAFCGNLEKITLHNGIKEIETQAFMSCGKLLTITIPKKTTYIGYSAFAGCSSLTSVVFEEPTGWVKGNWSEEPVDSSDLSNPQKAASTIKTSGYFTKYNY